MRDPSEPLSHATLTKRKPRTQCIGFPEPQPLKVRDGVINRTPLLDVFTQEYPVDEIQPCAKG